MDPDDLLRVRRIHRDQLVAGRDPFAADAQLVFASELGPHFGESCLHRLPVFRDGEIGVGLVSKLGKRRCCHYLYGKRDAARNCLFSSRSMRANPTFGSCPNPQIQPSSAARPSHSAF